LAIEVQFLITPPALKSGRKKCIRRKEKMNVSNIEATVLVASTYEKKDKDGNLTGVFAGKLCVLVDAKEEVSTGEVIDFFTGKEFVGDVDLINTLQRFDKILLDIALVDFDGKTSKRLINFKFA